MSSITSAPSSIFSIACFSIRDLDFSELFLLIRHGEAIPFPFRGRDLRIIVLEFYGMLSPVRPVLTGAPMIAVAHAAETTITTQPLEGNVQDPSCFSVVA